MLGAAIAFTAVGVAMSFYELSRLKRGRPIANIAPVNRVALLIKRIVEGICPITARIATSFLPALGEHHRLTNSRSVSVAVRTHALRLLEVERND
jgi:hypothetical protein